MFWLLVNRDTVASEDEKQSGLPDLAILCDAAEKRGGQASEFLDREDFHVGFGRSWRGADEFM
jgi:hypothetical protein